MKKVTVIGNGAIGLCTAYYLQKEGFEVHIITASEKGAEKDCSYGNAGMIVPSHFIPLAAPGVIKQGIKWMLNSKSPFYIRPRFNIELIKWLGHFYASANKENVEKTKHLIKNLNVTSRDLFSEIEKSEKIDFKLEKKGLLMLYKTAKHQDEEEHMAEQAKQMGLSVNIKSKLELSELEKELEPNVLGGVLYNSDAHHNPNLFMNKMQSLLQLKGVTFHYSSTVTGFSKTLNKIEAIKTSKGEIKTDEVVICAGTWSSHIVKELDVKIPMQGGKGYSMTLDKVEKNLVHPSILCEAKIALTPMGNSLRVAGTMEIAGNDLSIRNNRLNGIKEQVPKYLKNFDSKWFERVTPWVGLRPVSPDGLPYIGRASNFKNLTINTGHAMMGLSLAPISGKLVSEILTEKKTTLNISLLTPQRF